MSTLSQYPTFIDSDGLPTEEDNDSQIFGFGTEAARPATGENAGDLYIVLDVPNGVYRWDIWNGSAWNTFEGNPLGSTSGTHGDILYRGSAKWDPLNAGTAYQFLQTQGAAADPAWSSYKVYPASANNPSSPAPSAGDLYYNNGLNLWMMYDGTRTKWLSVESSVFQFGRRANTAPGSYYRGTDFKAFSASAGYPALWNGTVVGLSYTREDSDSATFEVTNSGSSLSTLVSATTSGYSISLNNDFAQSDILGVRNQSGGNATRGVQGWVRVRWRDT